MACCVGIDGIDVLYVDARRISVFDLSAVHFHAAGDAGKTQIQVRAGQDVVAFAVEDILDDGAGGVVTLVEIAGRHGDIFAVAGRAARHRPAERLRFQEGVGFAAHDAVQQGFVIGVSHDGKSRAIVRDGADAFCAALLAVFGLRVGGKQLL
jgi:hypothetical protein